MILYIYENIKIAHIYIIQAKLIDTALNYCQAFSDNIDYQFTNKTIRLTAMTGSAAVEIGGDTAARQF